MTLDSVNKSAPLGMADISVTVTGPDGKAVPILEGFDIRVEPGEIIALCGRSGAGKTTAVRVALGLQTPDLGEVWWGSNRVDRLSDEQRARIRLRHVGYVPQRDMCVDWLTTEENVALAAGAHRASEALARVPALLERFGIAHRAGHRPATLSMGEQQRVALARALLLDPQLLLLDEPTANLDRDSTGTVLEAIADVRADRRAILVATHDPRVVEIADRTVELL